MRKPACSIVSSAERDQKGKGSRGGSQDRSEAGYLLIAVLFLAALILLALAVAAPQVAVDLQRDKEGELFHRGMQYAGAIRRYYRRFGAYPNNLDQLEKSNNLRFLRRRYKDPITGKDEWKLIRFGQSKTTGAGLFGQAAPSADSGTAGAAASGAGGSGTGGSGTGGSGTDSAGSGTGGGSSTNGAGGSSFGNSGSSFGNSGSSFGNSGSSFGNSGSSFGNSGSSFGNSGSSFGNSGSSFGGSGSAGGQGGSPGSGSSFGGSGSSGSGSSSGTGNGLGGATGGATFGGGQIIGVSSTSDKQSIREFKKQTHYNQWEFVYDQNADGRLPGSTGTGVSTTPGTTQPNNGAFGGSSSGGSFGSSNNGSFGPQPSSPNSPTAPPTQ